MRPWKRSAFRWVGLAVFSATAWPMCRSSPASSPNVAGAVDAASPSHSSAPASSASADTAPALSASAAAKGARSFVAVALPGSRGGIGFDDLTFAPLLHRILAPAGRTGKLDLIDPTTQGITPIAGFAVAEQAARGHEQGTTSADEGDGVLFAIDRTTQLLHVIDAAGLAIVASVHLAGSPDYVRWVPSTGEVWVTEPDSERIELFSMQGRPPQPKHAGFIQVKGGPESLVIDAKRQRGFTHLWKSSTVVVDLRSRSILFTWPNGCAGSRGIALDEDRGFLLAACAEGKAVTLDANHGGKQLSQLVTGSGVDIVAYSPLLRHLYVPGASSATLTIAAVSDTGELRAVATVPTVSGAHCVAADDRGGIWVCDPQHGQLLFMKDDFATIPE